MIAEAPVYGSVSVRLTSAAARGHYTPDNQGHGYLHLTRAPIDIILTWPVSAESLEAFDDLILRLERARADLGALLDDGAA